MSLCGFQIYGNFNLPAIAAHLLRPSSLPPTFAAMLQEWLFRILLSPLALLYGVGVSLRDFFYRVGLLKSVHFDIPVISVGNLSVGGVGKTPHIEYLIRLLQDYIEIATLSRGYRRKTAGFLVAGPQMSAEEVGDEPLQFKRKFPEVMVTVGENRAFAIPRMLGVKPDLQLILLDDAFQHRAVTPGLNILLTDYNYPFTKDYLLPAGRLREWRSAYHRADTIIVTKCPTDLTVADREIAINEIAPLPNQRVYFSYYAYQNPYYIFDPTYITALESDWDVVLISAIAGTDYLLSYLEPKVAAVHLLEYEDHHYFEMQEMIQLKNTFDSISNNKKIILTTEKDAMRLELHRRFLAENRLPVFSLPVEVRFLFDEGPAFDQHIKDFLLNFKK